MPFISALREPLRYRRHRPEIEHTSKGEKPLSVRSIRGYLDPVFVTDSETRKESTSHGVGPMYSS